TADGSVGAPAPGLAAWHFALARSSGPPASGLAGPVASVSAGPRDFSVAASDPPSGPASPAVLPCRPIPVSNAARHRALPAAAEPVDAPGRLAAVSAGQGSS